MVLVSSRAGFTTRAHLAPGVMPLWSAVLMALGVAALLASPVCNRALAADDTPAGAIARLGSARWVEGLPVFSVAFSPDGKRALSGSRDCTILVWQIRP